MDTQLKRRDFVAGAAAVAGSLAAGGFSAAEAQNTGRKILNYNQNMEYRRLGRTGLMVSAVCLGGHWKRVGVMMRGPFKGEGYTKEDFDNLNNPEFVRNRHEVVSRCIELGINYVDACSPQEILAYAKVLKGRRDKMYFGYSWHTKEPRFPEWRNAKKLVEGLDAGLKEAGLEYVDLWRISLPMQGIGDLGELLRVEEATVEGLQRARQQGKARFTGVSSHNRIWLKSVIEQYPKEMDAVLFPYTADSKELPDDSVFEALKKHDVGAFGIKPFADNSLFKGDSSPTSPHAEEDDGRARLALRYILSNPMITAPIPGLVNQHQVDNAARAVMERRRLDRKEKAELNRMTAEMWANLSPGHRWLKDWEYV
jgi:aryl-alcohol dehydrogenase-like predicted oxidoreductase